MKYFHQEPFDKQTELLAGAGFVYGPDGASKSMQAIAEGRSEGWR